MNNSINRLFSFATRQLEFNRENPNYEISKRVCELFSTNYYSLNATDIPKINNLKSSLIGNFENLKAGLEKITFALTPGNENDIFFLPDEIFLYIMDYLSIKDLISLKCVNQKFKALIKVLTFFKSVEKNTYQAFDLIEAMKSKTDKQECLAYYFKKILSKKKLQFEIFMECANTAFKLSKLLENFPLSINTLKIPLLSLKFKKEKGFPPDMFIFDLTNPSTFEILGKFTNLTAISFYNCLKNRDVKLRIDSEDIIRNKLNHVSKIINKLPNLAKLSLDKNFISENEHIQSFPKNKLKQIKFLDNQSFIYSNFEFSNIIKLLGENSIEIIKFSFPEIFSQEALEEIKDYLIHDSGNIIFNPLTNHNFIKKIIYSFKKDFSRLGKETILEIFNLLSNDLNINNSTAKIFFKTPSENRK